MVDLHLKPNMAISNVSSIPSPRSNFRKPDVPSNDNTALSSSAHRLSYEHYLRLPELSRLWTDRDFPEWKSEPTVKPALQALEITFRLVSHVLSDPRRYSDTSEWKRRLGSLCSRQLEVISSLLQDSDSGIPVADLGSTRGVLVRERSSQEVWRLDGSADTFLSRTSESSLLPRLAAWEKSSSFAQSVSFQIESLLHSCPFTLGLGEPNLAGKPSLEYDLIVRPTALHSLKKRCHSEYSKNQENDVLFTIHHVLESWLCTCRELLREIGSKIELKEWSKAASGCWLLERIWKMLSEIEDLHLMMDPDDFLRLKSELAIKSSSGPDPFCFRSAALLEVTNMSKNLKHNVPNVLGVEVDPNGGPRVQEAAMRLFHSSQRGKGDKSGRLHLLQAFQAVEGAVKKFFFGYRQLVMTVMGSLEATGNRGLVGMESSDTLSQMFMEPPYFPSLDAAKTFLGELWQCELNKSSSSSSLKQ
ncbi:putative nematode resistance protein-like HSPRO1 [Iris pallida]|uniref:Nematode resistance protein-like HSPRO1 n=1 Tax=Iris pallida TaxID=29817 RepID=A0AAX6ESC4_IRIPA|nr:putative nematode resistance protein-like HSPRO1 [Iris pallida]KAJ6817924.1 putative nematode resistance protein-like HSPRO1 [Iris pallida]